VKRINALLILTVVLVAAGLLLPTSSVTASKTIPGTKISVPGGSYRAVAPRELAALLVHKNFVLVNVHYPYAGELPHTDRFLPFDTIGQHLSSLPANKHAFIVLYCRSGRMSDIAARTLVLLGFTNVWHLAGGMDAWEQQGFKLLYRSH